VDFCKRPQFLLARPGQFYEHAPAVVFVGNSVQKAELRHAIDQFDGRVMANKKKSRQISHGNCIGPGKALDGEKRLILLRRQAGFLGGGFAECQEFPNLVAKFGKRFIVDGSRCMSLYRASGRRHLTPLLPHPILSRPKSRDKGPGQQ
jgi:hypothetical protein